MKIKYVIKKGHYYLKLNNVPFLFVTNIKDASKYIYREFAENNIIHLKEARFWDDMKVVPIDTDLL